MEPIDLLEQAFLSQKNSKSKYSGFSVGCALLTNDNEVILGCNIESAAYPSTMCAERVAIYSAISKGITNFKSIAIVSSLGAKPCGPCRQIAPIVNELASDYQGKALIGKVNIDHHPTIAQQYGIRGIPSLLLFSDGEVQQQIVGAVGKKELAEALDKLI